ncbi:MAG: cadmium-translocating P-type ATPase [Solobacterium sp.]|nr:cadmium-translocating P-type ATPase [Solobacterium sp.]
MNNDHHSEYATYRFGITGIDCADCAAKLEGKIAQIQGISNVVLNFMTSTLTYDCDHDEGKRIEAEMREIVAKEEPDASVTARGHKHHHQEHHHEEEHETATYKFEIAGIDCANCAAKLEGKIAQIQGISDVVLNFMTSTLTYDCDHDEGKRIEAELREIVAKEEPDTTVTSKGHSHHHHAHEHHHEEHDSCSCPHEHDAHEEHEACECHSEHHHEEEHETATYKFEIAGIDCANCAAKLEGKIAQIEGVSNVVLNFMTSTLTYDCDHDEGKRIEAEMREIVAKEEQDATVTSKGHSHHHHEHHHEEHETCECHTEHHHEEEHETATYKFEIAGIDCADCAAKLEGKIAKIEGISNVVLNFMTSTLTYDCDHDDGERIETEMRNIVAKEEPDTTVTSKGHSHHHHAHEHHHEEHEMVEVHEIITDRTRRYSAVGIDCADCAAKLEGKIAKIDGISNAHISFMNSTLTYDCDEADVIRIENEVKEIFAKEEPDAVVSPLTEEVRRETKTVPDQVEDKSMLYRLLCGAVLFAAGLFLKGTAQTAVELAAYLVLGWDVLYKAVKGIGRGQVFDEHFLMAVATIAAIYLKDYREAAGVMLFYQIGEYFQDLAVAKSRRSIGELMDIRPESAEVYRRGQWQTVDPDDVRIGERIRVRPGERVPLDGIILSGASSLDTSSLTGESKPRDVDVGDEVISGSVNQTGVLEMKVTKEYGDSTVARILDLVENQESRKSSQENFITKFSRVYTPAVVFSAIAVAVIVSLLGYGVEEGVRRACTFLVISCPCALVISIPLSFFAGIGGLSSRGILVKGANLIEPLAKVDQVVMDKTGTLTSGKFAVEEILAEEGMKAQILEDGAYAESLSNHPVAVGIREAYGKQFDQSRISEMKEIAGRGVSVNYDGHAILVGNYKLMQDHQIECRQETAAGTLVYVARDGVYEGCLVLRDQLKPDAKEAVRSLQAAGKKCIIVSGDNQETTDMIAKQLGMDMAFGECMPADKVERLQELKKNGTTAFIGDGVNDAPVLTAADTGFAMGALGSDAAIEAADVVIMDDQPSKISLAITSAQRILRVANQNIYGAIIVKVGTLILGAFGIANMWMAIFADTGVAMLCVMNSMRLLHIARKQ